jgi:hypothetical protein
VDKCVKYKWDYFKWTFILHIQFSDISSKDQKAGDLIDTYINIDVELRVWFSRVRLTFVTSRSIRFRSVCEGSNEDISW